MRYTHGRILRIRYVLRSFPIIFSRKFYDNEHIERFEKQFKEFIGVNYAIATSSARFALYLLLKSLDIEEGKTEIIAPSYMPQIVAAVLIKCGLKPVFVDIDPNTLNIDPKKIEGKITKNTKFILAVHLHGIPCDLEKITKIAKKHNLFLIEDCAQAFNTTYNGKKVGSFGDASIFSTSMYKNFNTCGGGLVVTNDTILNDKIREEIKKLPHPNRLKILQFSYTSIIKSLMGVPTIHKFFYCPSMNLLVYLRLTSRKKMNKIIFRGVNSGNIKSVLNSESFLKVFGIKYTNFQAKIGLMQLSDKKFWEGLNKQNNNVNIFYEKLGLPPFLTKDVNPSYSFCFLRVKDPEELIKRLSKEKVVTFGNRYPDVSTQGYLKKYQTHCLISQKTIKSMIYFPFRFHLNEKDMLIIAEKLKKVNPKIIKPENS